jgi:hypothetical protein
VKLDEIGKPDSCMYIKNHPEKPPISNSIFKLPSIKNIIVSYSIRSNDWIEITE